LLAKFASMLDVSIHAPGEGSDLLYCVSTFCRRVSIHAPGEGSDLDFALHWVMAQVSIHAPGEGSDERPSD